MLKSAAKAALLENLRELARIIQNHPGVTNAMREELLLPLRASGPTPVPVPAGPPRLEVVQVQGHNITVTITDATGERRGKPRGCQSAMLFTHVGNTPPETREGWVAQGCVTRRKIIVAFPDTVPGGSKVFLAAAWQNFRGLTGPACTPVVSNIGFDGTVVLPA